MQLAEIKAYGGNLAAGRPVTASSSYETPGEGWRRAGPTDGNHLSTLWNSMGYSSATGPAARTEWAGADLVVRIQAWVRAAASASPGVWPNPCPMPG